MEYWYIGIIGLMMAFGSYWFLNPSSIIGTIIGMVGIVLFVFPFYYYLKRRHYE